MKKRNKRKLLRIIAVVLTISMLVTAMPPMTSSAKEVVAVKEVAHKSWSPEEIQLPNTEGDLTLEQLKTAKLAAEDTPEIVSAETIKKKGHVNRLWAQEQDLSTLVFQNKDGTKTAYHYSDPVKYKDKSGKIKDKKNKLSKTSDGDYTNPENDINAYFSKKIHKNKGIELKFGKYVIEMAPNINGSSGASRQTGHDKDNNPTEYVEYPEVFADDISLRYTPTFGGYKEDIILAKNTGINRFEFKLTTNGLSLVQASTGNYYLAEPLTGEYVTALGNVVVYDKNGRESEGYNHYYQVTTISEDEEYLITVVVDENYLESANTKYPVYVDPTLEVVPKGQVEDATLYSTSSETSYSGELKIGYSAPYSIGRALFDFPIFKFEDDFIYMYGNQIVSAELNLYATIYGSNYASYNQAKTLSLYEYNHEWSPSTVKWSNTFPNDYGALVCSTSVTTEWTKFDITSIINKFKTNSDYTTNFKGVILKADTETYTTWKKFVSSYGTSSRRPYISITYNDNPPACPQVVSGATYYLKNYNGDYLDVYDAGTADNTRLLTYAFNGNENQQFKITNVSGGEYEIAPQHTTGKVLSVNNSGQVIIEEDCNKDWQRWYIYYRDGEYHIVNKQYKNGIMAPTYDTDYVSINNEYEYCCWELEFSYPLLEGLHDFELNIVYNDIFDSDDPIPFDKRVEAMYVFRDYLFKSFDLDQLVDDLVAIGFFTANNSETRFVARLLWESYQYQSNPSYYDELFMRAYQAYFESIRMLFSILALDMIANLSPFDSTGNIKTTSISFNMDSRLDVIESQLLQNGFVKNSNQWVANTLPTIKYKQGVSLAPNLNDSWCIYQKLDNQDNSLIVSQTKYGMNGQKLWRDDYYIGSNPHTHFDKVTQQTLYNHRHYFYYNSDGLPIGEKVVAISSRYN